MVLNYFYIILSLLFLLDLSECIRNKKNGFMRDRDNPVQPTKKGKDGLQLTRYNQHQDCVDELYESDLNNDLKINESEYVVFIGKRSNGAIIVDEYSQLPFSLISNFVYGSCFCSLVLQIPNCCVGDEAAIELDPNKSPFIEDNLATICRTVDEAIITEIGTLPPTEVSTTEIVTSQPSEAPSFRTSSNPTTNSSSFSPTENLTSVPSGTPSEIFYRSTEPSDAPYSSPAQSDTPTDSPSNSPSNSPSGSTNIPTEKLSESPTSETTAPPTVEVSTQPTDLPTRVPSSESPSLIPSIVPTRMQTLQPTPDDLACVHFQYGIENDAGLDARDILDEKNNTYKIGLIAATRDVTIQILNGTSSQDKRRNLQKKAYISDRIWSEDPRVNQIFVKGLNKFQFEELYLEPAHDNEIVDSENESETWERRRAAFLPGDLPQKYDMIDRRLAFYTDSYPPMINNIFDNLLCQEPEGVNCAVVDSTVCVMLEKGDDKNEVQKELLKGIQESMQDGNFEQSIPAEHLLPPQEERIIPIPIP